jgi:hypothetical protein
MRSFSSVTCLWLVAALALLCGCEKSNETGEVTSQTQAQPAADATPSERAASPDLQKLKGNWVRVDGDYMIEVSEVDAAGKLSAKYFNPGPIHVSKAIGLREGSTTKMFVELQDTGYPGCTYSLNYDPASDQLFGEYFQAGMQRTYDVVFARMKRE